MKTETLLMLLGGAGLIYWLSQQNQTAAPAATGTQATGTTPAPTGGSATPPPTSTQPPAPPATTPTYTGPSLAQMYQALQAAVSAAYGSDPAITCGDSGGSSLSGMGLLFRSPSGIATRPTTGSTTSAPSTCANYMANSSVFNWYLVNRANVGIVNGPAIPGDNGQPMTLAQYWAAVSPIIQNQTPGLSGTYTMRIPLYGGWA